VKYRTAVLVTSQCLHVHLTVLYSTYSAGRNRFGNKLWLFHLDQLSMCVVMLRHTANCCVSAVHEGPFHAVELDSTCWCQYWLSLW